MFPRRNNKIIENFALDGTHKHPLVQLPCKEQGHLKLNQVVQSPVQPDLKSFQGWDIHQFPGQNFPVPHHSQQKKILAYIRSEVTLMFLVKFDI